MGQKQLRVDLTEPATAIPAALAHYDLTLDEDGDALIYTYDTRRTARASRTLLSDMADAGLT